MGMDLWGRKNKKAEFSANISGWPYLQNLVLLLAEDLFPLKEVKTWSTNDGFGPTSERKCKELSRRMRNHTKRNKSLDDFPTLERKNNFILRFADFLDECGGFKVY